ncbi:MAG: PEGA domain-containing protein [Deltaproteobacteria bacterium]|nr:PEGA domain-containing protein [Deltaproteobacteria bacterium]
MTRPRLSLFVGLLALQLSVPAAASDKAKAFFQAGAQAYDSGRFDAAVEAFEEAYRLAPLPAILFSMAQAERKQFYVLRQRESLDRAIVHYRAYLEAKGAASRRAEAADALAELEAVAARLVPVVSVAPKIEPPKAARARLMVTTQAPRASVAIDDEPPVDAPFIGELDPGRHRVRVTAEGFHAEERELELVPGPPAGLDLPLKERAGRLSVEAPAGTEIYVNGRLVGEVPLREALELPSGPHAVTLIRRGLQAWTGEVVLERGKQTGIAPAMERTGQRVVSWTVLGVGAAALLAGGACTAAAYDRQGVAEDVLEAKQARNIGPQELLQYGDAVRARDRWRTAAQVSTGAGAGLLAIGALLYWLDRPAVSGGVFARPAEQPSSPLELGAAPLVLPSGAGLVATGRF